MARSSYQKFAVAGYLLALLGINAYICQELFVVEYTGYTNSVQGLWIAMARLAGEHWYRPAWWPFQDGGIPFEHTYMPLVPGVTALYAKIAHCSAARAFNAISGIVYCLGPLALFVMAWRMTGSVAGAFAAGLAYTLLPGAHGLRESLAGEELPDYAALALLPLLILALWRAVAAQRRFEWLVAGGLMALMVLASPVSAALIVAATACLPHKGRSAAAAALTALVVYVVISPLLPPSLLAASPVEWSATWLTAIAKVVLAWQILAYGADRWIASAPLRYFLVFAFLTVSMPRRFHFAMEMTLVPLAVFSAMWVLAKFPRPVQWGVAALLVVLAGVQVVTLRKLAKPSLYSVDVTSTAEYRVAKWLGAHASGQRVMASEMLAAWMIVWAGESPGNVCGVRWGGQFACPQSLNDPNSLLRLKASGVQAIAIANSQPYDGVLPVAYREAGATIYRLPQRSTSLAHIVPADEPSLPPAQMEWKTASHAVVRAAPVAGQAVSLQVNHHPGWHARVNGVELEVQRDALGFILLRPACSFPCEIDLYYDGGLEARLCRWASTAALLGMATMRWRPA